MFLTLLERPAAQVIVHHACCCCYDGCVPECNNIGCAAQETFLCCEADICFKTGSPCLCCGCCALRCVWPTTCCKTQLSNPLGDLLYFPPGFGCVRGTYVRRLFRGFTCVPVEANPALLLCGRFGTPSGRRSTLHGQHVLHQLLPPAWHLRQPRQHEEGCLHAVRV